MHALSVGKTLGNECIVNPTYYDYKDAGFETQGCGTSWLTNFYFLTYLSMVTLLFLNLFIAIIINGYLDTLAEEEDINASGLSFENTERFIHIWSVLDPNATGQLPKSKFDDFMYKLGEPLGWGKEYKDDPRL